MAGSRENVVVKKCLERLWPGENIGRKYLEYRAKKSILVLAMVIIGILSAVCAQWSSQQQSRLTDGRYLDRNQWGKGSYFVTLAAQTDTWETELVAEIKEREFTGEELERMATEAAGLLGELIAEESRKLTEEGALALPYKLENYPFSITWRSSNYDRIRADGSVLWDKLPVQGEKVMLTALLSCQGQRWEYSYRVTVMPKEQTAEQKRRETLKALFSEADLLSEREEQLALPETMGKEVLIWKEKKTSAALAFFFLGLAGAVAVALGMDRELQKQDKKRREEISLCYPGFVSRLCLYMGAGLTTKNAFLKIGEEYKREKEQKGKRLYLYEEVLGCSYRFLNGAGEESAYHDWGKRCDEINCRKLGFLLSAHVRVGNEKILSMLAGEMHRAFEEKRNRVKKQGEEAGTKLLLPMILMLIEVMLIILLPVFTGVGGV